MQSSAPKKPAKQCLYREEYCELLENHMGNGYSFESFGGKLKVDRQTLYNWTYAFPEFKKAKDRGVEASRLKIEKQLMRITKTGKGNIIGAIFMLKNRFPNEWRDKRELEVKEEPKESLTIDQQLERVEIMREQLLQIKASQEQDKKSIVDAS